MKKTLKERTTEQRRAIDDAIVAVLHYRDAIGNTRIAPKPKGWEEETIATLQQIRRKLRFLENK